MDNAGNWNLYDFHFHLAAVHTPDVDALMSAFRDAQNAVQSDEARVRRLIKPYLGDMDHNRLKNARNRAMAEAREYLLDHQGYILIEGRSR